MNKAVVTPISAYLPQQVPLVKNKDEQVIPGLENLWVIVCPPTWEQAEAREQFIDTMIKTAQEGQFIGYDLVHWELYQTFGGTNMSVVVPKMGANGRYLWEDNADGLPTPVTETIEFCAEMTQDEFVANLKRIPESLVDLWYKRVLEVVPNWAERFRR